MKPRSGGIETNLDVEFFSVRSTFAVFILIVSLYYFLNNREQSGNSPAVKCLSR